jgi:hypothetical protein
MSQKAYYFWVQAPENACVGATAAVVSTATKSALHVLREARLKIVRKQPVFVTTDLSDFPQSSPGVVLFCLNDEEAWNVVRSSNPA